MTREVYTVSSQDRISKAIGLMEKHDISSLPVLDQGVEGIVTYRRIVEKGIDATAEVKAAMIATPEVSPDESIVDLAYKLYLNGLKSIPVTEGGKLVGIITRHDLTKAISKSKEFDKPVSKIMSKPVLGITWDKPISKAREIMLENHVRRLPVVDNRGRIMGIITLTDIAAKIYKLEREAPTVGEVIGEKIKTATFPVEGLMSKPIFTAKPSDSLAKVGELMVKNDFSGVPIVEKEKLVGMVTMADLVRELAKFKFKGILPISIQGIEGEPEWDIALTKRLVKDHVSKLANLMEIEYAKVYVKKYEREGLRKKYSIRAHLRSEKGLFIAKHHGWKLSDIIDRCMDKLEKQIIQAKQKKIAKRDIKSFKEKIQE